MRILMCIHHDLDLSTGAAGTTMRFAREYRRAGHSVDVLAFDHVPMLGPGWLRTKQVLFPWRASLEVIRRHRHYDVVDASTGDLWPLFPIRNNTRRRWPIIVARSHGLEHASVAARRVEAAAGRLHLSRAYPLYHGGWRLREVEITLRNADAVFLLNQDDRSFVVEKLAVDPGRVHVLPNGVEDAFFERADKGGRSVERAPVIAQIGSYSKRKGSEYAIPALQAVLDARADAEVLLLGVGVPAATVLDRFTPGQRSRVTVIERYENGELPHLLARVSVSLSAAVTEGFGKTILESMACGVPVVASGTPGANEIVRDGVDGILVEIGDARALAVAMLALLDDPSRTRLLGARAQERARDFTWTRVARQRLEVYHRLMAG